jgi:ubiquinone/menaquinone biosynthesis C-methylase UbiE
MAVLHGGGLTSAFDKGSAAYDRLVGANPGYHRHLRRAARAALDGMASADDGGLRVLDLGCGTGASTAALLAVAPDARITAVDASAGMLARAAAKPWPAQVSFRRSAAEDLAGAGVTGPFDVIFAAYLVRNLADPDAVLRSLLPLLRPGGRLAVQDYTLSGARLHRLVWTAVCRGVIMPLGALTSRGSGLYTHLWRSVLDFDTPSAFARRLAAAGYTDVGTSGVPGWQRGILHTFVATRPAPSPSR